MAIQHWWKPEMRRRGRTAVELFLIDAHGFEVSWQIDVDCEMGSW